ncbi:hypothetical protein CB0940_06398 [Cercospora beticola]|uniref:Uncharacterized protein n=1 Tax=Cercospora beticola TaxID=122368 RepID=A0A2G5I0E0_CERBT|nr:hypothetical protein CB0940_06398 [Cercospora beticola]PIA98267.1 hypothetical protein CB0940_06398 [Cercospora beticola]WPA99029.1 hypothetical protein RHO25_003643 [Cercospora beticola]
MQSLLRHIMFSFVLVTMVAAWPAQVASRSGSLKQYIGALNPGSYSLIFKVREGVLEEMTLKDKSGSVYADTAPGWGWGPSDIANEIPFEVEDHAKEIVFTASEPSGHAKLEYELKKTDAEKAVLLKTGQID